MTTATTLIVNQLFDHNYHVWQRQPSMHTPHPIFAHWPAQYPPVSHLMRTWETLHTCLVRQATDECLLKRTHTHLQVHSCAIISDAASCHCHVGCITLACTAVLLLPCTVLVHNSSMPSYASPWTTNCKDDKESSHRLSYWHCTDTYVTLTHLFMLCQPLIHCRSQLLNIRHCLGDLEYITQQQGAWVTPCDHASTFFMLHFYFSFHGHVEGGDVCIFQLSFIRMNNV